MIDPTMEDNRYSYEVEFDQGQYVEEHVKVHPGEEQDQVKEESYEEDRYRRGSSVEDDEREYREGNPEDLAEEDLPVSWIDAYDVRSPQEEEREDEGKLSLLGSAPREFVRCLGWSHPESVSSY